MFCLRLFLFLVITNLLLFKRAESSEIVLDDKYEDLILPEHMIYNEARSEEGGNVTDTDMRALSKQQDSQSADNAASSTQSDPWDEIESALNTTTLETPFPPFNKTSVGACVRLASDSIIIFGKFRDEFQNVVSKCSRKALGSHKNTFRCLEKHSFGGAFLSEACNDCWARTAHCGVKHCASVCLFRTCSAKCQKCSTNECSRLLNECAGTTWMPLPCGLSPHEPIPEEIKASDP